MARALYRTYRSRSLDEVIGQEHITDLLKQALDKGAVSHAYLLTGPRGTGKTSVARILAHEINALPYSDDPHLDIIEIDAASNRRIDDIRDLRSAVHITPVQARYKVYIIDEVHMLTTESFNALLKTLEEPPEHVVFILATTEAHKVPATILSRTQRYHFRLVDTTRVADHLATIADKEGIAVDRGALEVIARHGGGSFRDSVSLLDQLAGSNEAITKESVERTLGLVPKETLESLTGCIIAADSKGVITALGRLKTSGTPATVITDQLVHELSIKAGDKPALFELIDRLLDVQRAHDPFSKLTAVLVMFTEAHRPRTAAVDVHRPVISAPVVPAEPPMRQVAELVSDVALPVAEQTALTRDVPQREPLVQKSGGVFDWEAVLASARTYNAPLHSVLSRARAEFVDNTLTLHFIYALHRKKLEQPQYRSQLSQLIHDICAVSPEICVKDGKTLSPELEAVAAIMGGGELTHAS